MNMMNSKLNAGAIGWLVILACAGTATAGIIPGVSIEDVSSELLGGFQREATRVIDGSGFDDGLGTHVVTAGDAGTGDDPTMWLSHGTFAAPNDPLPAAITFDLERRYDLSGLTVWNYNEVAGNGTIDLTNRGSNEVEILVADSEAGLFTSLGSFVFTQAPGADDVDFGQFIDLSGFPAADDTRLIRFDILSNHGDTNQFAGLSEVRFDGIVIPEPASVSLLVLGMLLLTRRAFN